MGHVLLFLLGMLIGPLSFVDLSINQSVGYTMVGCSSYPFPFPSLPFPSLPFSSLPYACVSLDCLPLFSFSLLKEHLVISPLLETRNFT